MELDREYIRTVESSFGSSAPFRVEFREYPANPQGNPGVWQVMHNCNGAIIATGATPAGAVANLARMAEQMTGIVSGLPHKGQKQ